MTDINWAGLLDQEDVEALERLVPLGAVAGSRYGEAQMKQLDSEAGR